MGSQLPLLGLQDRHSTQSLGEVSAQGSDGPLRTLQYFEGEAPGLGRGAERPCRLKQAHLRVCWTGSLGGSYDSSERFDEGWEWASGIQVQTVRKGRGFKGLSPEREFHEGWSWETRPKGWKGESGGRCFLSCFSAHGLEGKNGFHACPRARGGCRRCTQLQAAPPSLPSPPSTCSALLQSPLDSGLGVGAQVMPRGSQLPGDRMALYPSSGPGRPGAVPIPEHGALGETGLAIPFLSPFCFKRLPHNPPTSLISPQPPLVSSCCLGHQFIITGKLDPGASPSTASLPPSSSQGLPHSRPQAPSQPVSGRLLPHIPVLLPALSLGPELWSRMISCNWPAIWLPSLFYRHAG